MTLAIAFPFAHDSVVLDPYFGQLLEGFSGAAAGAGYGFLLVPARSSRSSFPLQQLLSDGRFDGAIVADPAEHDDLIPLLQRHGVPVVTTGRYGDGETVPWVDNDNRGGMVRLLEHLREAGYRRPAMISMSRELSFTRDVEEEFVRLLGAEVTIVTGEVTEQAGYRAALALLDADDPPDALVATSDRQAIGALRAAQELGIAVPEELGIAGSGDTLAAHAHPPITSIAGRTRELGEVAVELLLSMLDDVTWDGDRMLETHVVVRETTDLRAAGRRGKRAVMS
jgi:DNA-binding LacI/PurR family transcriptional regulator